MNAKEKQDFEALTDQVVLTAQLEKLTAENAQMAEGHQNASREFSQKIAALEQERSELKADLETVQTQNDQYHDATRLAAEKIAELEKQTDVKALYEDQLKKLETENEALKAQIQSLETQLPKRMPKIDLAKAQAGIRAQVCI